MRTVDAGGDAVDQRLDELSFEDWKGLREVHRRVAHLPFCEQVVAYMDYWRWDATDFFCETGLPSSRHSEIIHGKRKALQADSIMAICKGLRLTRRQAEDVFRAARLALSESEDEYFLYLLEAKGKWGIPYETKHGSKRRYFADYTDCKATKICDDNICNVASVFQSRMVTFESRLKAGICELCGTTEAKHYEIHHVHKVKDLKGKEPWERMMIAKRRKTIVLCRNCHYEIHGRVLHV